MNSKAAQDRQQRILQELVRQPGNNVCADCKSRAPQWALWNLGIFVCVQCAGIHRKMGVHVSKVKSLTLDNWTKEQVDKMKEMGNLKSNKLHNPDEMRNRPPTNMEDSERDSELEKYIRQKYETRRFMAGRAPPVPTKDATFLRTEDSEPRRTDDSVRNGNSISRSKTAPIPSTWSEAQARTKSKAPPVPVVPARSALPSAVVPQRSSSAQVSAGSTVFDDLISLDTPSQPAQPPLQMNPWATLQAQQPPVYSAPAVQTPSGFMAGASPSFVSPMQQHAFSQQQYQQTGLLSPPNGSVYPQYAQSANLGTMAFSTSPLASPGNPFVAQSPHNYAPQFQGQMQAGFFAAPYAQQYPQQYPQQGNAHNPFW